MLIKAMLLVFILCLVFYALVCVVGDRHLRRIQQQRKEKKPNVLQDYFSDIAISRDRIRQVDEYLKQTLDMPELRLHPDDRLCGELGICGEDIDDAISDLIGPSPFKRATAEQLFREGMSIVTVEDLVMFLSRLDEQCPERE